MKKDFARQKTDFRTDIWQQVNTSEPKQKQNLMRYRCLHQFVLVGALDIMLAPFGFVLPQWRLPHARSLLVVGVYSIMYHLVFSVRVLAFWPAVDPTVRRKQCAGRWLGWDKRQCHCLMSSTAVLMEAGSGWITCTCLGTKSLFNCSKWWGCKSLKNYLCIYLFTWWESQYLFLATKGAQIYEVKVSTIALPWSCRISVFMCLTGKCEKFYLLQAWLCVWCRCK